MKSARAILAAILLASIVMAPAPQAYADVKSSHYLATPNTNQYHKPLCPLLKRIKGGRLKFDTAVAAQAGGFAPCKSCKP